MSARLLTPEEYAAHCRDVAKHLLTLGESSRVGALAELRKQSPGSHALVVVMMELLNSQGNGS